jgi:pyridoxal phosphate enzyme (YggS family)
VEIAENYKKLIERISAAAQRCGRSPEDITLVAVTKHVPAAAIEKAVALGVLNLGENRVQEALLKVSSLQFSPVHWHFIGHLQTNKVRLAVKNFQLIHSVDSLKLAKALDDEGAEQGRKVGILLQVNISGEGTKQGFSPEEITKTLPELALLKNISIGGLMTMAPFYRDLEATRPVFKGLREIKESLEKQALPGVSMRYMSMGMSNDFEVAIEEGATHIRIGTALFGTQ